MADLDKIEKLLLELKEEQHEQSKVLAEMHFAIFGNEKAGIKGIASKVVSHEKYIEKDKRFKWVVSGVLMGGNIGFWAWIKSHLPF
jgi:hypothetical protein